MAIKYSFWYYLKKELFNNIYTSVMRVNKTIIMTKKVLTCFFLLMPAHLVFAQNAAQSLVKLHKSGRDTNLVNIQLQLGEYYLQKPGELKKDLDSCRYYIELAKSLSIALHDADHVYRALILQGRLSIEAHDFDGAGKLFKEAARYYHSTNEPLKEASVWIVYADCIANADKLKFPLKLECMTKARDIYLKNNYKLQAARELEIIADNNLAQSHFDQAEQEFISVIKQYYDLKYLHVAGAYYYLADTYYRKGEMQKELLTRINCVNSYEADPNRVVGSGPYIYFTLAVAYYNKRKFEDALNNYQKSVDRASKLNNQTMYYLGVHEILSCYANLKQYKTAFAYLKETAKKYPVKTSVQESMFLSAELKLYNHMENSDGAEKLIPRFKKIFKQVYKGIPEETKTNYYAMDNFVATYDPLPKHYFLTKQWLKLSEEVKFLEKLPTGKISPLTKITIYDHRFQLDSARGDFLAALKKFQRIKIIKDSLNNVATDKQINELETKYESVKKDKTIQDLNNQSSIQKSNLEKSNLQRNITFAGTLVAIILVGLLYFAYRNKQRSNFWLRAKQEQINSQNDELSALVKEKEKLLIDKDALLKQQENLITEKEWLLKEVHHRVKNNLQIVMSLLYSQAAYLQNTDAIEAIRNSQNRVQAISIIHQKLYNKISVANIVMADYVGDLVRHLCACYDCNHRRIKLKEVVDPLSLDISQAVPMGLILNEAITNAIKYAFEADGGEIIIEARLLGTDMVKLTIADNGKGLPLNFNLTETSSLGMEMMKALSKQLDGSFEVSSNSGVHITISFRIEKQLKTV